MTNGQGRLVLIVDSDQRFVDGARPLLAAHRVLAARDVGEAREIVLGGRIDLVLLGPAFGSAVAVSQARILVDADPSLQVALAADVVTNRLLKEALKGGFVDVLDLPLKERDLDDVLRNLPSPVTQPTELAFVVEPAQPAPSATAAMAAEVEVPESEAVLSAPEGSTEDVVPASEVPDAPIATVSSKEPISVSTPTEVWFQVEPVAVTEVEEMAPSVLVEDASPEPQSTEPVAAVSDFALAYEDMPPTWPPDLPVLEEADLPVLEEADLPVLEEADLPVLEAPTVEAPPPMDPSAPLEVPEAFEQFASMPPSIPDVLDQVLPPPPSVQLPPARIPQEERPPAHHWARSRSWRGSRVIAVMAGKGGSGKTITVTNLAIALGLRADPERVAIVDADLQFGDVALMLQMDPVRTLGDLVDEVESLSDQRVGAALLRHDSGIRVLPAPMDPAGAGGISAKSVVEVVNRLRSIFDTVVIDTGPVFDDFLITVLESADDVLMVVDMDLPSVKNAQVALDGLRLVGFDMDRIRLVMNRANSKVRLDLAEVERSLGLKIGGSIPSDRLVPQGVNDGVPALARRPRSKVARSFQALAESLDSTADRDRITDQ